MHPFVSKARAIRLSEKWKDYWEAQRTLKQEEKIEERNW
jgi:hypothetical protein